jgi:hypothetical protein
VGVKEFLDRYSLAILMGIFLCFVFFVSFVSPIVDITLNTFVHNETMTTEELDCKKFCLPDKYFYDMGNIFTNDICLCEKPRTYHVSRIECETNCYPNRYSYDEQQQFCLCEGDLNG